MGKCRILLLLAVLLGTMVTHAQEETSASVFDQVEELNSMCPLNYGADWGVNSFTMVGDNYALADMMIPSNLSMILTELSAEGDKVKRLWIDQFKEYGTRWQGFVDLMVETNVLSGRSSLPESFLEELVLRLIPLDIGTRTC